jgi:threonine aldolase
MAIMAVDLRSDTLTLPSDPMRQAMAGAEVGDDVFGEDPTIGRLERRAAQATGKEEGIFVASGTMGNLLALLSLGGPGQEIVADADSHIFLNEGGGAATLGGIQIRQVATTTGVMSTDQLEAVVRPTDDYHQPITRAICLEDTHNRHGGVCWPLEDLARVRELADRQGLAVHLDGARVFNAAVAQGVAVGDITAHVDT